MSIINSKGIQNFLFASAFIIISIIMLKYERHRGEGL